MTKELVPAELLKPYFDVGARIYHRVAHDEALKWAQERQHLLTILEQKPDLMACTPESLVGAVVSAGAMGLSLNPNEHACYIIPRRARKMRDGESRTDYNRDVPTLAYASPGYRGLVDLAIRGGAVSVIAADVVFQNDTFKYRGPLEVPLHEGVSRAQHRKHNQAVGVYCVVKLRDGQALTTYLDSDQVERIRKLSEAPNGLMWHPDKLWTEGWKKAAIRRAWKTLPHRTPGMTAAMTALDRHEGIVLEGEAVEDVSQEVERIGADEVGQLRTLLLAKGIKAEKSDEWLKRLAIRFGLDSIDEMPRASLPAAKQLVTFALEKQAAPKLEAGRADPFVLSVVGAVLAIALACLSLGINIGRWQKQCPQEVPTESPVVERLPVVADLWTVDVDGESVK